MRFPAGALHRLSGRVRDGDVVFFVGTGFSVDSEGNTPGRLMRRLLLRLQALCEVLETEGGEVAAGFAGTFALRPKAPGTGEFRYTDADVDKLSDRYYEANDWFCRGFGQLLLLLKTRPETERPALWRAIARREEELRQRGGPGGKSVDEVPFDALPEALLNWIDRAGEEMPRLAGKSLFLDTMGFRHSGIMGGSPGEALVDEVAASYARRLRPRHHVIARFAREGFCGTTLTTNYDLLLEGAFRLAGFRYEGGEAFAPPSYFDEFARIASPAEFFTKGKALRTPTLVKMHGCSQRYRDIPPQDSGRLARYLRSMVFTYREIQNWRQDSWAADYLRTLLRTRTVVFGGYSLRDPVIHDTFRTVYEEMAREKPGSESGVAERVRPAAAPAYFITSVQDFSEFYGMEVLRAASTAVGAGVQPLAPHPNYIRFHFGSRPGFPHLDEVFRWLFHSVFRRRQRDCLASDLERVLRLLLGKPRPADELHAVRRAFDRIWVRELRCARSWGDEPGRRQRSRREQAALCGWTDGFGSALLREFACADHVHRCRGPGRQLTLLRTLPWHCPTTHSSAWTCWGAVVEIAMRRMAARLTGDPDPFRAGLGVRGVDGPQPTLLFPPDAGSRLPDAVTIRYRGFDALGRGTRWWGLARRRVYWELDSADAPWPVAGRETAESNPLAVAQSRARGEVICRAPDAGVVWRWACGTENPEDRANLPVWMGSSTSPA